MTLQENASMGARTAPGWTDTRPLAEDEQAIADIPAARGRVRDRPQASRLEP